MALMVSACFKNATLYSFFVHFILFVIREWRWIPLQLIIHSHLDRQLRLCQSNHLNSQSPQCFWAHSLSVWTWNRKSLWRTECCCADMTELCCAFVSPHRRWCFPISYMRLFLRRSSPPPASPFASTEERCWVRLGKDTRINRSKSYSWSYHAWLQSKCCMGECFHCAATMLVLSVFICIWKRKKSTAELHVLCCDTGF